MNRDKITYTEPPVEKDNLIQEGTRGIIDFFSYEFWGQEFLGKKKDTPRAYKRLT